MLLARGGRRRRKEIRRMRVPSIRCGRKTRLSSRIAARRRSPYDATTTDTSANFRKSLKVVVVLLFIKSLLVPISRSSTEGRRTSIGPGQSARKVFDRILIVTGRRGSRRMRSRVRGGVVVEVDGRAGRTRRVGRGREDKAVVDVVESVGDVIGGRVERSSEKDRRVDEAAPGRTHGQVKKGFSLVKKNWKGKNSPLAKRARPIKPKGVTDFALVLVGERKESIRNWASKKKKTRNKYCPPLDVYQEPPSTHPSHARTGT